jgi:hypothetical protein
VADDQSLTSRIGSISIMLSEARRTNPDVSVSSPGSLTPVTIRRGVARHSGLTLVVARQP